LIARTGSRGPLAALLVCPAALWFVPRRREPEAVPDPGGEESVRSFARFARRAVPAVIGVMVIAVLALPKDDREAVVAGLMRGPIGVALEAGGLGDLTSSISVSVAQDPSTVYRRHLAQRSLATLSEALPWGAGTGSFPALLFMRDARLYPHNILAELLIENGWPGLALFVLFVLLVWRSAWRLSRRSHAGRWLFVLFAMALSNAQVSGDTGTNEWIWLWAGMIAGLEMATRRCAESLTVRTVPRVAFK
jgi:hypothetical protein